MTQSDGVDESSVVEDDGVLDASDTLDGDPVSDPLDTGIAPADRWSGANRYGTTAAEERAGEPLDLRLSEEEPDIDPYADGAEDEDEDDLIRRGYESEPRAGRLADDDGYSDGDGTDLIGWDAGVDGGGASAEEAAIHIVAEPDGEGEGPRT